MDLLEQVKIFYNLDEKLCGLKRKLEVLKSREDDVNEELKYAESLSLKKRKKSVENWLENVGWIKNQVQKLELEVQEGTWYKHLQLWHSVEKSTTEVTELIHQGRFPEGLTLEEHESQGFPLLTTNLVGKMFEENKKRIWGWLMNDDVCLIGIWGMGGVGKTTIATHIHNQIQEQPNFCVSWVSVSQNFSVHKLQSDIAKTMHLDLGNEDDEMKRAAKLAWALERRKNLVLILDDVWDYIPLDKVGIIVGGNVCQLILTTRFLDLCRRMGCEEKIKVKPLSNEEAWELFTEKLGPEVTLPSQIERIARHLVEECAGLPLGIITMARSMREAEDISEWSGALEIMKEAKLGLFFFFEDMENDVFQVLRYSYDKLKDPKVKECFLYCSLYPEDFEIEREMLVELFIDERLIVGMRSRQAEFNRGHTILNKLENACLLEGGTDREGKRYVKMHDLVRDMALQITNVNPRFLIEAGVGLTDIPCEEKWAEDLVRISFMCNEISDISSSVSPRSPRLLTLRFNLNRQLKSIPNCFFVHMSKLNVLDLSCTAIENLPESLSGLVNLNSLLLRECHRLKYVPSLADLKDLRRLDLSYTSITEVPQGMETLVKLRYLNLYMSTLHVLPDGILPKLSNLQYLVLPQHFSEVPVRGDELASVRKLETFQGTLLDIKQFNIYVRSLEEGGPAYYMLRVGLDRYASGYSSEYNKVVVLIKCDISESKQDAGYRLLLPKDVEFLSFLDCHISRSLCNVVSMKDATNLRSCSISLCKGIEHVLTYSSGIDPLLQSLEELNLTYLLDLRGLFGRKGGASFELPCGTFSSLRKISVIDCPKIEKLFTLTLIPHLQNLENIHVKGCKQMVEIIAKSEEDNDEDEDQNRGGCNTRKMIAFPKLKSLELWLLPELKSICNSKKVLVSNSLHEISIAYRSKLKQICLFGEEPRPPLCLKIYADEEWWESLEWNHSKVKDVLQPFCKFWSKTQDKYYNIDDNTHDVNYAFP